MFFLLLLVSSSQVWWDWRGACYEWGRRELRTGFWWGNMKKRKR